MDRNWSQIFYLNKKEKENTKKKIVGLQVMSKYNRQNNRIYRQNKHFHTCFWDDQQGVQWYDHKIHVHQNNLQNLGRTTKKFEMVGKILKSLLRSQSDND